MFKIVKSTLENQINIFSPECLFLQKLTFEDKCFYEKNVKVDLNQAVDTSLKTLHQPNDLWLNERKKKISGSTGYSFFTIKNPERYD